MTTPTIVQKIEALHERLERARVLVADGRVTPVLGMDEHFIVASSSGTGSYLVNATCTCPDANDERRKELIRGICKHKLAVILYMEAQHEGSDSNGNDDNASNKDTDEGTTGSRANGGRRKTA